MAYCVELAQYPDFQHCRVMEVQHLLSWTEMFGRSRVWHAQWKHEVVSAAGSAHILAGAALIAECVKELTTSRHEIVMLVH